MSLDLTVITKRFGAVTLPDNNTHIHRMHIRSESSTNLYVVAQHRTNHTWQCSCRGWIRHRNCKHLQTMMPMLTQAKPQTAKPKEPETAKVKPIVIPAPSLPNEAVIMAIPQQRQTQTDLNRQLAALRLAANRLGLYDAADFIRKTLEG